MVIKKRSDNFIFKSNFKRHGIITPDFGGFFIILNVYWWLYFLKDVITLRNREMLQHFPIFFDFI